MVTRERFKDLFDSLSGRLVVGVFIIHLVLMPFLFGSILIVLGDNHKDTFVNNVRSKAGYLVELLSGNNIEQRHDLAVNLLDNAILSNQVMQARLILGNGQVVNSSMAPWPRELVFEEDLSFDEHHDEIYFIGAPLLGESGITAPYLQLAFDESETHKILTQTYTHTFWIGAGYILLNLFLVLALGRHIAFPLQRLREASRRITRGLVNTPLEVHSTIVDIQELAFDLNQMRAELVHQAAALEHQALHDALTGLPNRLLLEDRLNQATLAQQRQNHPFALLMLDLDRFKDVNDTLGHQAGDEVLKQATIRLREVIRELDTLARLGGDEFAIIVQDTDQQTAEHVARNLVRVMANPFDVENQMVLLGGSIGIALCPSHGTDPSGLMRRADIAMYQAKRDGGGSQVYNDSMDRHAHYELTISSDLSDGIHNNELVPYLQPKIDLHTGMLCGAEALVRWQHPRNGLMLPDQFIYLAERSGLINDLTEIVLTAAAKASVAHCGSAPDYRIAVNLSPLNLLDSDLPSRVAEILSRVQLSPDNLQLELTETAILKEPNQAREILNAFKNMGIEIVIDDFGTGYSSLINLRRFPVSEIKIDKSFVIDMLNDEEDQAIVRATIRMALDLGLRVTAEGVEDMATATRLGELGCDRIQGYLLAKPMPVADFQQWARRFKGLSVPVARLQN